MVRYPVQKDFVLSANSREDLILFECFRVKLHSQLHLQLSGQRVDKIFLILAALVLRFKLEGRLDFKVEFLRDFVGLSHLVEHQDLF